MNFRMISDIFIYIVGIGATIGLVVIFVELLSQVREYFKLLKISKVVERDLEMYALKFCPFCGGEAKMTVLQNADTFDDVFVKCEKCGVHTTDYLTEEDAEAAWNQRIEETGEAQTTPDEQHEQLNKNKPGIRIAEGIVSILNDVRRAIHWRQEANYFRQAIMACEEVDAIDNCFFFGNYALAKMDMLRSLGLVDNNSAFFTCRGLVESLAMEPVEGSFDKVKEALIKIFEKPDSTGLRDSVEELLKEQKNWRSGR